jgi:hypothetical protein
VSRAPYSFNIGLNSLTTPESYTLTRRAQQGPLYPPYLRPWFRRPKRGTHEDKDIGKEEGEIWEELEEQDRPIGGENGDEDGDIITVD